MDVHEQGLDAVVTTRVWRAHEHEVYNTYASAVHFTAELHNNMVLNPAQLLTYNV